METKRSRLFAIAYPSLHMFDRKNVCSHLSLNMKKIVDRSIKRNSWLPGKSFVITIDAFSAAMCDALSRHFEQCRTARNFNQKHYHKYDKRQLYVR